MLLRLAIVIRWLGLLWLVVPLVLPALGGGFGHMGTGEIVFVEGLLLAPTAIAFALAWILDGRSAQR